MPASVLADTNLHKQFFFSEQFKIDPTHFGIIPVGADESLFYPQTNTSLSKDNSFSVFFTVLFCHYMGLMSFGCSYFAAFSSYPTHFSWWAQT
ncbi:MAG: hypothetical protein R3E31_26285 [Chloroflexota bacterium]